MSQLKVDRIYWGNNPYTDYPAMVVKLALQPADLAAFAVNSAILAQQCAAWYQPVDSD